MEQENSLFPSAWIRWLLYLALTIGLWYIYRTDGFFETKKFEVSIQFIYSQF